MHRSRSTSRRRGNINFSNKTKLGVSVGVWEGVGIGIVVGVGVGIGVGWGCGCGARRMCLLRVAAHGLCAARAHRTARTTPTTTLKSSTLHKAFTLLAAKVK